MKNIEAALARDMVRRTVVVGPAVVIVAWALRGADGAVAAAIGVAVVVANFLAMGAILSLAARISLTAYHAAALFGFLVRLVTITLTMLAVAHLFDIDRVSFGVAAVATYMVLLTLEAIAVARAGDKEMEWTS